MAVGVFVDKRGDGGVKRLHLVVGAGHIAITAKFESANSSGIIAVEVCLTDRAMQDEVRERSTQGKKNK